MRRREDRRNDRGPARPARGCRTCTAARRRMCISGWATPWPRTACGRWTACGGGRSGGRPRSWVRRTSKATCCTTPSASRRWPSAKSSGPTTPRASFSRTSWRASIATSKKPSADFRRGVRAAGVRARAVYGPRQHRHPARRVVVAQRTPVSARDRRSREAVARIDAIGLPRARSGRQADPAAGARRHGRLHGQQQLGDRWDSDDLRPGDPVQRSASAVLGAVVVVRVRHPRTRRPRGGRWPPGRARSVVRLQRRHRLGHHQQRRVDPRSVPRAGASQRSRSVSRG